MKNNLLILSIVAGLIIVVGLFYFTNNNKDNIQATIIKNNQNNDMEKIKAVLKTNLGDIVIELDPVEAPITVNNFVTLAKAGFYDGTRFHRVIKDFMIQGGDPLSKDLSRADYWGTGGPDYAFRDEINNIRLVQGVIAMANSGPNTNGSQFFIITAPETDYLYGRHTGFGKVISGLDVVLNISFVDTNPQNDRPINDVILEKVVIE